MTSINACFESPASHRLRYSCLQFASCSCDLLNLQLDTKQRIYILIDSCLRKLKYRVRDERLLTVSCIVFMIKFEGDFTRALPAYINACKVHLQISLADIMKNEFVMLELTPNDLYLISTFSEAIETISTALGLESIVKQAPLDSLIASVLRNYIEAEEPLSIVGLCLAPIISCLPSGERKNNAFRQATILLDWCNFDSPDSNNDANEYFP